ncbi:S1 family peptidase [Haloferula sp.]|uniref:S1 family peptidase n=1 Tax=Haloferula sp. TaxID=2497595 RepID=UPI00329C460D
MIREFLSALFVASVVILSTSCSSSHIPAAMLPTSAEREAALAKFSDRWELDVPVKRFGLARSVGIVEGAESATSKTIPKGMATLVTHDGYALTANHVVSREGDGLIAAKYKDILIPAHMGTSRMTLRGADGRVKEQHDTPGFGGYYAYVGKDRRKIDFDEVIIRPVRVVKRFEATDLALVKTDLTTSSFFRFSEFPERSGALFASGNPFRYRASAAGEVISVAMKDGVTASIHTSVPLSPGDSGSPVFNGRGQLVGITTDVFPKGLLVFPASIVRRIDPAKIATAIAEDRAQNQGG